MTPVNKGMTWGDAAFEVLKKAKSPLHYKVILKTIEEQRLRAVTGKTPAGSLYVACKNLKSDGLITLPEPGVFALAQNPDTDGGGQTENAQAAADLLFPHGRYWQADSIDWKPTNGNLWGYLGEPPPFESLHDFADHPGLYVLHHTHAPLGILYVGKTDAGLYQRLRNHRTDKCEGRWDSFSWFSLRGMRELEPTDEFELDRSRFLKLMEAFMLECFLPPLNNQRTGKKTMFAAYEQLERESVTSHRVPRAAVASGRVR